MNEFYRKNFHWLGMGACVVGVLLAWIDIPLVTSMSTHVSEIFMKLLKLISLPVVFFSIISAMASLEGDRALKVLGKKTMKYTLLTTLTAASVALGFYVLINPVQSAEITCAVPEGNEVVDCDYFSHLLKAVPDNILFPFSENNILGILVIALLIAYGFSRLRSEEQKTLAPIFSSFYQLFVKIAEGIILFIPLVIIAFVVLFVRDVREGLDVQALFYYIACVVGANLVQACVVLPLFLKSKGHSPLMLARNMWPALTVAFFSKSSTATLPMTLKCATQSGVDSRVARFCLPLCSTVNMNACAAFILITVLFVSSLNGVEFGTLELLSWIFIATIAAIGNAAVPMGCYFLASAFLASQNIPITLMAIILPFYSLLDMLETAINVWSDSCVTLVVNSEAKQA